MALAPAPVRSHGRKGRVSAWVGGRGARVLAPSGVQRAIQRIAEWEARAAGDVGQETEAGNA